MDPEAAAPFVAEALETLRKEVGPETAVLGFVGCPYTLATYLVEGQSSRTYLKTKTMMLNEPKLLHAILSKLAENIAQYALFQIAHGAQLIQIFDSWAGELSPHDYDTFAAPYQKVILDAVRTKKQLFYFVFSGCLFTCFSSFFVSSSSCRLRPSTQRFQL
jgi:uroporphyrinogen decarboxylase